jgi:hypothetical protein
MKKEIEQPDLQGGNNTLLLNYLRITKLRVGLILNFKHSRLEWERIVL